VPAPVPTAGGIFNKTLFDPAPYGAEATASESSAISQRPTAIAPPMDESKPLAQTMNDPSVAQRALEVRAMALEEMANEAKAAAQAAPASHGAAAAAPAPGGRAPAFAKTMMLGGGAASDLQRSSAVPTVAAPPGPPRSDPNPVSPAAASGPALPATASAPRQPVVQAAPPSTRSLSDKQTMLGMPALELPPPSSSRAPAQQPQAVPPMMKTMIGVAIPGIAPTHAAPPPASAVEARAGTLLGVAIPGIAPLQPGREGAPLPAPAQAHPSSRQRVPTPPPIVPAPAPLVMEPLPEAPQRQPKKGVPAIAVVGIVFVLVALIGTGAALLFLRSGAPLTAQPQLDETGKESLKIRCESCPDGTAISLGAASSTVMGAAAVLPLPAPLTIGDNDLEMKIDRPAAGRDETVKIHVPVAYRVKADLAALTTGSPSIIVRVEASAGTEVTVDGKAVSLDSGGKGSQAIDVTPEVEGPSDDQKSIDKKIAFSIKPKGAAAPETGNLVVRAAVVPLHLDAPGAELITDRATAAVAGQTKSGTTLTVDGQPVALDAQGRFGVRVELPSDGEKPLTIVASAPPLATRTVRAKVVRVASLDAAAKALDARTPLAFDVFAADPASMSGKLVVIDGEVVESRVTQGHTVMLIEEKKACSGGAGACVVRIVHGDEVKASRGDSVHAYGRVVGTVSSGGKSVPDIEGSLVITRPGTKK
jgi:hypothetical protein